MYYLKLNVSNKKKEVDHKTAINIKVKDGKYPCITSFEKP